MSEDELDGEPIYEPREKRNYPWPTIFLVGMVVICILGIIYSAAGGVHG